MELLLVTLTLYYLLKRLFLFATAVGRYATRSFKFGHNDAICELKGKLEDSYESSQSMIFYQIS